VVLQQYEEEREVMRTERRRKTSRGRRSPKRGFDGGGGFNPDGTGTAPVAGFRQEVKGAEEVLAMQKGKKERKGKRAKDDDAWCF
jgi:hypothetical protein